MSDKRTKKKEWTVVSQQILTTPEGRLRVTIEVPFDWHFKRAGGRRLPGMMPPAKEKT